MCLHLCVREKESENIAVAMWQTLYGVLGCRSFTLITHWRTHIFRLTLLVGVAPSLSSVIAWSLARRAWFVQETNGRGYWYSIGFCKGGESMGYYYSEQVSAVTRRGLPAHVWAQQQQRVLRKLGSSRETHGLAEWQNTSDEILQEDDAESLASSHPTSRSPGSIGFLGCCDCLPSPMWLCARYVAMFVNTNKWSGFARCEWGVSICL